MKKLILFLFLGINHFTNAQCPSGVCVTAPMDFTYSGNGSSLNNKWTQSYGSPTVGPGYIWLWSYSNRGEGVNYSGYQFVAGRKYCISYTINTKTQTLATPNANAQFNMVLTPTTVTGNITASSGAAIPAIPNGSQSIVNTLWSTFPNNAPNTANNTLNTNTYNVSFTANSSFNNLWIYPSSPTLPQVEVLLSELTICDITVPPCDASFDYNINVKSNGEKSLTVTNQSANGSSYIVVSKNGNVMYNGTNTTIALNGAGNYKVCNYTKTTSTKCESCSEFCIGGKEDTDIVKPIDKAVFRKALQKVQIDDKLLKSE